MYKRYVEKRNGENVIPLRNAICGIDMPKWELQTVNDNEMFLSGEAVDKLAELEDRIENKTLIDLPCKVGDWLYYIYENKIHKAKVEEIKFNVYKHGIKNESIDIFAYDFKNKLELSFYYKEDFSMLDTETIDFVKTFLTKAEAEAKLKELRGEV